MDKLPIYSVRASGAILRRGAGNFRRRAGLTFGESEQLVSAGEYPGVQQLEQEQIDAILHDSNLRDAESTDPATAGLRVKLAEAPDMPATEEPEEAEAPEGEDEGNEADAEAEEAGAGEESEPTEGASPAPAVKRRGRPPGKGKGK